MNRQQRPRVTDARLAATIFIACLAVYLASGRARAEIDCVPAPYAAWSFVRYGTFDLRPQAAHLSNRVGSVVIERPNGVWISKYPPGSTWAALPLVAPLAALRSEPPSSNSMLFIGKLVASAYSAAAAVFFYFACRAVAAPSAAAATILFALGTSMWSTASQALWMHGPATFWLCVALYVLVVHGEAASVPRWTVVGVALGMAIATRPTTVLFAVATGVIIWSYLGRKATAAVVAGATIPLAMYVLYTLVYFGPSLAGGYGADARRWDAPLIRGIVDLLVSSFRGLLVYSPALVLAPLGVLSLLESPRALSPFRRAALLAWTVAALATIVLYAKWFSRGGWSFGPRFLCETMPAFCLLFALAYSRLSSRAVRRGACALVGVSIVVQLIGVFGNHPGWYERQPREELQQPLFAFRDSHIEANARVLLDRLRAKLRSDPHAAQ